MQHRQERVEGYGSYFGSAGFLRASPRLQFLLCTAWQNTVGVTSVWWIIFCREAMPSTHTITRVTDSRMEFVAT